jgi:hypothetical protein
VDESYLKEIKEDQAEITRASQKVKSENLVMLVGDLNQIIEDPLSPEELKEVMHKRGIPMRLLGKICTTAHLNHMREIAVTEIVARSTKLLIQDGV